ncbi:MAG: thioredoxin-disulfide reductase [Longimicrobiales bacterium]|nr:thioredoxin-disulfide reductase [Longimicrobiales bacterium]
MPDQRERVVIIGSGPAGWTAAIYAARANLDPFVIEGAGSRTMIPGGQLMFTTEVENYPGFPDGVTGPEMMMDFRKQAERFGTRILTEDVVKIELSRRPRLLHTSGGKEIEAESVIIATGANARWLGVPGEERLARTGGGVSACAVCDGALPAFRDARLAVVGGGDSAMEEAIYLTNFASEVFIIHRRDEFRASPIMAQRALDNEKITVLWNTVVTEVHGEEFVEKLSLEDTVSGENSELAVGGLFVAIGHEPNVEFLDGQLPLRENGYVELPDGGRMATGIPGVFVAGDVTDDYYRQAVTAAGMGCMAALEAERWLAHEAASDDAEVTAAE